MRRATDRGGGGWRVQGSGPLSLQQDDPYNSCISENPGFLDRRGRLAVINRQPIDLDLVALKTWRRLRRKVFQGYLQ